MFKASSSSFGKDLHVTEKREMATERTTGQDWRRGFDGRLRDAERKVEVSASRRSLPWEGWRGTKCSSENAVRSIQEVGAKVMCSHRS